MSTLTDSVGDLVTARLNGRGRGRNMVMHRGHPEQQATQRHALTRAAHKVV
ncbi:hypothetical protein [Micromonospora avicenniae]|uniref:hypothetical protein n=1 Tax=Micromonospora avicenniae TaxID=1198245 RepID=UPI0033251321